MHVYNNVYPYYKQDQNTNIFEDTYGLLDIILNGIPDGKYEILGAYLLDYGINKPYLLQKYNDDKAYLYAKYDTLINKMTDEELYMNRYNQLEYELKEVLNYILKRIKLKYNCNDYLQIYKLLIDIRNKNFKDYIILDGIFKIK